MYPKVFMSYLDKRLENGHVGVLSTLLFATAWNPVTRPASTPNAANR
jgi:hypothetical protein